MPRTIARLWSLAACLAAIACLERTEVPGDRSAFGRHEKEDASSRCVEGTEPPDKPSGRRPSCRYRRRPGRSGQRTVEISVQRVERLRHEDTIETAIPSPLDFRVSQSSVVQDELGQPRVGVQAKA